MGNIFGMAFNGARNIGEMAFNGTKASVHAGFLGINEALATSSHYMSLTGNRVAAETLDGLRGAYNSMTTANINSPQAINQFSSYLKNKGVNSSTVDTLLKQDSAMGSDVSVQLPSITDVARFRYGSTNGKGGYNYNLMAKDSVKVAGAITAAGVGVVGINAMINGD